MLDWRAALARLEGAYSDATVRAYQADVAAYVGWCDTAGEEAFPATPERLARYLAQGLARHAPATIRRRMVALRKAHHLLGLPDPISGTEVALAFRRRLRLNGRPSGQAVGLTAQLRDQLIAACPSTLHGARDAALIAVGYDLLARRSELVALRVEDLIRLPSGAGKVLVRRSKTDPFAQGRHGHLSKAALGRLDHWLAHAGHSEGPMFRPISGEAIGDRPLHPLAVNRALKLAATRAGWDRARIARLSGHSLRVGAAQDLVADGRTLPQIMLAGRWTSAAAVASYAQAAELDLWG
jgi:integrase